MLSECGRRSLTVAALIKLLLRGALVSPSVFIGVDLWLFPEAFQVPKPALAVPSAIP
jgi:hypothetical protein